MTQVSVSQEFGIADQPHDLEWMMVDSRRRQSEAARKLTAKICGWTLRTTGLSACARFLANSLLNPLRVALLRRQTLANLEQLDDRLLADIGIERAIIPELVVKLVSRESVAADLDAYIGEPVTAHNPIIAGDVELVKSVTSVAPKAAANSNESSHRAA